LPHRTAPIGQIQRDSLNLICWPRGRGIFRDAQKVKISDGLHPSRSVGMAGYNPQLAIGLANEWPEHSVASHAPKVTSNDVSTNHLYK